MPLIEQAKELLRRQNYANCDNGIYDNCYYNSPWSIYGRWILLGAIIVGAFLIFLAFSCLTARRRRRAGLQPLRGTGWASGGGWNQQQYGGAPAQQPYYGGGGNMPQNELNSQPPPQYQAGNGFYGKPNNGQPQQQQPYGGQQNGVELQEPQHSYNPQRGGESVYAPPAGPPPGKTDGIVR